MRFRKEFIGEIGTALRNLVQNELNSSELNRLIKLAANIARQRLYGRIKAASIKEETTVECLSTSLISDLFQKDSEDFVYLAKALKPHIDLDGTAFFLKFQNIVVRIASQELFHRWKENDQLSSRLWRNLHCTIRMNAHIIAFPADCPRWIAPANESDLKPGLRPIEENELNQYIGEIINESAGINEIIIHIFKRIKQNPLSTNAIQIEKLFAALKNVSAQAKAVLFEEYKSTKPDNPLLAIALEKASARAINKTDCLLTRYNESGKLPGNIVGQFRNSLAEILFDHSNGGIAQSYYEYLKSHWPGLEKSDYRKIYRAKFEYLVENALNEFNAVMKNEYFK